MKKQNLVCENINEFIDSQVNEGIFDKAKEKISGIMSNIKKMGTYYVAQFKDYILDVILPVNIGIMIKNKKAGKYDFYIPSTHDLKLEPSLSSLNDKSFNDMLTLKTRKEIDEFNAQYKSAEDYFNKHRNTVSESKKEINTPKNNLVAESIEDMAAPKGYNIPDVDMEELTDMIYSALDFPLKPNPLLIWGAPGIGKTSLVNSVLDARKQEGRMIYLDIQYTTPESWFMPYLQKDKESEGGRKYVDKPRGKLPLYLPAKPGPDKARLDKESNDKANDGEGGIIFLDELMRGTPQVLGTCLSLMAGRKIEDWVLGDKWTVIAASNRKKDMTSPELLNYDRILENRFQHVNYVPEYVQWKQWAQGAGVDPRIIRFLDHNFKDLWYAPGTTDGEEVPKAWASQRSWTDLSTSLAMQKASCEKNGRPFTKALEAKVASGCVGTTVAEKFLAFIRITDLYPMSEINNIIIAPEKGPRLNKVGRSGDSVKMTDVTAISLISIAQMVDGNAKVDPKHFTNFCKWLVNIDNPSAAAYAVRMLVIDEAPYMHEELGDHKKDAKGNFIGIYKEGGDILIKKYGDIWNGTQEE